MAMHFDLKKIFAQFQELPGKLLHQTSSVIGIDIGSSAIKVVQLKKEKGKAVLETYGSIALGSYAEGAGGSGTEVSAVTNLAPEKLTEALGTLFKEAGVTSKNSAIGVPSTIGLVFLIELPPQVKPAEFNNIIPTEARKFIPVPISEVLLDWFAVPKKETEYEEEGESKTPTEILVVAIPKDALARLNDAATNAGLESPVYEHEIFSAARGILAHQVSPVLIMDFGASKTKLAIVERGIVRVFHSINRGSADITNALSTALGLPWLQAEERKKLEGLKSKDPNIANTINLSVDFILGETNNVVLNFQKKYNKGISEVFLTGGGASLPGLLEKTRESLRTDVFLTTAFDKTEAPEFLNKTLGKASPEFATAIGLALKKL